MCVTRVLYDGVEVMNVTPPVGGFWPWGNEDWQLPDEENMWQGGTHMAPFDEEVQHWHYRINQLFI